VHEIDVVTPEAHGIISFHAFVLPPKEEFSTASAFDRAAGPRKWNDQQGLYIYRANRMIQSGGWSRMRANDEHTKLARASLDFYPDLDAAFGLDIKKARVDLPSELRDRLKDPVDKLVRAANARYRKKSVTPRASAARSPMNGPVVPRQKPDIPSTAGGPITSPVGTPTPASGGTAPPRLGDAIEEAARAAGCTDALDRIVMELRRMNPDIAHVLGW
jgi:hypothetical protein